MLTPITNQFAKGGTGLSDGTLAGALKELQGLNITHIAGAAANTKIDIASMRIEDTIIAALVEDDVSGVTSGDDKANITIQTTAAFGTITVSGNPVAGETFVVNGATYTFRSTFTNAAREVKITAGDNTAMASAIAAAINGWENRKLDGIGATGTNTPAVVATSNAGVVTVTSVVDGVGNGVVLTGTVTVLAAAGNGTASATLTPVTVVADNTCVISGVTFTAKAVPVGAQQFYTKAAAPAFPGGGAAGTDLACGQWLAKLINNYEQANFTLDVVATANATTGVVTLVPRKPFAGNIITLTEAGTNVAVTGSGTLTGGTATGGIKSTTNLTAKHVTVYWFNKQ